ncbi:MAG: LysM peptidoglycan-binding domain-containing protein [Clostridiales bacterium]|nr:LysM peptidoglycan-binding domain-containing protein [Clostridiales bacterium]
MKKTLFKRLCAVLVCAMLCFSFAATGNAAVKVVKHTVIKGESMWLIAVKYQVGLSEIIAANDQVKNPALIYPNQILNIPLVAEETTSFEEQVVNLTNQKRRANGLSDLKLNWELSRVARYKSQDMHDRSYFSHTSPTYGSPFKMMSDFGISYRSAGENIARGQTTPQAVVNAWWNSEGHRANMLNASYTQIGVGYYSDGNYWTQMFIG